LPNIVPIPKQLARAKVLEVGIIGTICHNTGKRCLQLLMLDVKKGRFKYLCIIWEISTLQGPKPSTTCHFIPSDG
jgi:hypothetical protein